jgi:LytR cell envelope-related transcriptional attenuator
VGAKHEPSSSSSFFISLATATLRGVLVVAAVILGVFVLSRAFPTSQTPTVPQGTTAAPETQEPQTPVETGTPTSPATEAGGECPDPGDVPPIQVLNGTDVTGLAADAAERLVQIGYRVPQAAISNASSADYDTSVVLAKPAQEEAADCLVQEEFRGADREAATPDAEYEISVILGFDYANRQGG